MQATIYVSNEAMSTAIALKDIDYYTRLTLSDEAATDLSQSPGYYLKNANKIQLAPLPENFRIALTLDPRTSVQVSMPPHLRGCIFAGAPNIPENYAELVAFWSGEALNVHDSRAVHFQSPLNEYLVELRPANTDDQDGYSELVAVDKLLSEGVVVSIHGLNAMTDDLADHDFIQVVLPIDEDMVGIELEKFRSSNTYAAGQHAVAERIYLLVGDIRRSPNPDAIYIDIIRSEMIDYGYIY